MTEKKIQKIFTLYKEGISDITCVRLIIEAELTALREDSSNRWLDNAAVTIARFYNLRQEHKFNQPQHTQYEITPVDSIS
jgi:hypothetical protein